jgi:nucleotide-binding universal stress UspA family protein
MVFERVLVGFDGSPASERALAVALALRAPDGRVQSLTVAETWYATHAGMDAAAWDAQLRAKAESARELAEGEMQDVEFASATVTTGYAAQALLRAAGQMDADLIAVGAHGHGPVAAMILGSVAARVVHDADCSVLVAHGDGPLDGFPRSTVIADEGSSLDELVEASRSADLVVVGSGRPRVERLAQKARCSVLIAAKEPGRAAPRDPGPRATAGRS